MLINCSFSDLRLYTTTGYAQIVVNFQSYSELYSPSVSNELEFYVFVDALVLWVCGHVFMVVVSV